MGPVLFYTLESKRDVKGFFDLSDCEKKVLAVELMKEGILKVSGELGDAWGDFDHIFREISDSGYQNRYVWKSRKNLLKGCVVAVFVQHEVGGIGIGVSVSSRGIEVGEVAHRIDANEFRLNEVLGSVEWRTDEVLIHPRTKGVAPIRAVFAGL